MDDLAELRCRVLLATQAAFLGMIGPQMRAVICRWSLNAVLVRAHYHGPIDDAELDLMSEVESEILSHFPDAHVAVECLRTDAPRKIEVCEAEVFVFMRMH